MSKELRIAKALGDLARIEDFLCKTMGEKADIQTNLHALVAENLSRKERIAELEAEIAGLKAQVQQWQSEAAEAAGHELGLWPMGAVVAVGELKAEVAALREDRERLVNVARGCHDYGGGYSDEAETQIYHHGIQTVINAVEAAAKGDASFQSRVLESIGIDEARKEHGK